MKNLVRAFVVALTLTGAVASAHTATPSKNDTIVAKTSAFPVPNCSPNDPSCNVLGRK